MSAPTAHDLSVSRVVTRLTEERDAAWAEVTQLKAAAESTERIHAVQRSFYELTVKERDFERARCLRLERKLERIKAAIGDIGGTIGRARIRMILED
jgi:hypothetical protein